MKKDISIIDLMKDLQWDYDHLWFRMAQAIEKSKPYETKKVLLL